MHRWATKDTYEREEDEAERLVRPAPKVKPPRKDKRRETTHAERDPDTAADPDLKGDRDLSLNYKNVGGSLQRRVADRYLQALAGKPPPLIPVWDEQEQKRTSVPESRIKSNPSRYKRVQPGQTPGQKDEGGAAGGTPAAPPPQPAPQPEAPKPDSEPKPEAPKPGPPASEPKPEAPKPEGPAAPSKPDPKREAARAKLNQSFENEQARDAFIEKLPFAERGADGQLRVYDKTQKKSVPVSELSSAALEDLVERRRVEKLGEDTVAAFLEHLENPEIQAVLKDIGFLGGATKGKGDKEGPLATRLRALQKEGHPLESLPISKHIPELKGVTLPPDVRSVADLIQSTKEFHPKPDAGGSDDDGKDEEQGAKRVVQRFLEEKRHKSEDFRTYAGNLPSVSEKDGELLFIDTSRKPKKRVPFDKLPENLQAEIVGKFEGTNLNQSQAKHVEDLAKGDPQIHRALSQVAALAEEAIDDDQRKREGALTKRLRALVKEGTPLDELPIDKHLPELKGVQLPKGVETVADLVEAAKDLPPPEGRKRQVPAEERAQISSLVFRYLPPDIAGQVYANLHPDDQQQVVEEYRKLRAPSAKNLNSIRNQIQGLYQTDRSKIVPPEMVQRGGKKVPFASLSMTEQAEALNAHRNRIMAISLAGRDILKRDFVQQGMPKGLADHLVGHLGKESPSAEATYAMAMTDGKTEPLPEIERVRKMLEGVPESQKPAVAAYLQARDYQDVRRRYLEADTSSALAINEHVPTQKLLRNLGKAVAELRARQEAYPPTPGIDSAKDFRHRINGLLQTMGIPDDRKKAVQRFVDEQDADDYDRDMKRWKAEAKKVEAKRQKILREHGREGSPYRGTEPKLPELPVEPIRPVNYDDVRPTRSRGTSIWDAMARGLGVSRTASHRVLDRYLTCTMGEMMASEHDLRSRQAVYWGVEPYPPGHEGFAPYNEWEQAHARDLDVADETALLKAARDWLGQFVLDPSVMGDGVPDARFRAALDYAVYTLDNGKYSVGLHPALYNRLLARLAGQPEDETLLTVRKTARGSSKSPYHPTPERTTTMHASARIRSYAAKLANTQPHIAFDLMKLAAEQDEAEQEQQAQGEQDQGQQAQGQKKQGGQLPPALKEHMKKKEEKSDDDKEQGQKKQAYAALRHEVIRVASENLQARMALQPVLRLIKQIG